MKVVSVSDDSYVIGGYNLFWAIMDAFEEVKEENRDERYSGRR